MPLLCSLIIRSYNEQKHIRRLLEGIKRQTIFESLEVILVDSGSDDDTVVIAREYNVKVISIKPDEFSFGRALNRGCAAAKGDFLLFASAHVYPLYTDWVEKILQPFSDDKVALSYGRQVGCEVSKYSEQQSFNNWFPAHSNYDQPISFCNNANCAIRRELWKEQPYDETLTGLEDLDWASKIKLKGYKIAYEALAPIVHVHEETPARIKNRYRREALALKIIYPQEHFSFFNFLKLAIGNITSDSFHAIHDGIFFKEFMSIVSFRYMQFWGTYLGYRQKNIPNETLRKRLYYPNDLKRSKRKKEEQTQVAGSGEKIVYSGFEG
ncbi:glycosyltransferase family 2 protein [Mucilaginibacter sp. X4EP1]|uniref:glycosyltransferase family 2 protein n=1 Tax=Mucilaginibacter sp. X4EP1 TaxID=2723092 RepID=UPI002167C26B|nr:glycosyltransferase family A protein [Mucilaginibacter sp. X4EP1]MCS3812959.1 glycosyltransferase involved in cell wall biosynthesis [Mucilaginibacter sp. X4EP1]